MRKRKLYTKISLENALEDMRKNKLSAEKASIKHGVPVRTLRYRCKEKLKGFPNRCLTHNQETSLVQYVKYCAERAFPLTRKMIKVLPPPLHKHTHNSTLCKVVCPSQTIKFVKTLVKI